MQRKKLIYSQTCVCLWIYAYLLCFDTEAAQCWIRGKNCKSDKRSRGSDGNFGTFIAVIVLSCYCMIHLLYMSVCIFIHYCWRGIFKFGWFQTIFIFLYFQIMEKYGIVKWISVQNDFKLVWVDFLGWHIVMYSLKKENCIIF